MSSFSPLNADLHCHSVISDGTLTPEQLAERAKANGVHLWALTDHDELGGQQRAREEILVGLKGLAACTFRMADDAQLFGETNSGGAWSFASSYAGGPPP